MTAFNSILVPVDFSINTKVAVNKAIEMAVPGRSVIHLLHVLEKNVFRQVPIGASDMSIPVAVNKQNAEEKLLQLKACIWQSLPANQVEIHVVVSNKVEDAIITIAKALLPDLIIIGKNNHHSFLPFLNTVFSANLAESTNCPVLTVKPGAVNKKLKTVVIPVSDFFPKRKIELLSALSLNNQLDVHLLTITHKSDRRDDFAGSALLHVMRTIRYKLQCMLHHSRVHSDNKAMAILNYAEKVEADMLVVNPESEATITTWMSKKDITDILRPATQLQVLSVQPNGKKLEF